ncbi:hypothetical protein ATI45_3016 [Marinobacter sp. LV10MA510-1]|nr:hypothetical protein ATI45_3016 [Marinobacter sp. LV10MA510-1]PFG52482.1 hypothetical protein ATG98_1510 [Marinobacter sp. LV10R520-4]
MRSQRILTLLGLCLTLIFTTPVNAVSKCVAADGSVSYVQGNCPNLNQKKEDVRVWDSGRGMRIGPDPSNTMDYSEPDTIVQPVQPARKAASHPCNTTSTGLIERKFEIRACAVLSSPHDPQNRVCKALATGSWRYDAGVTAIGLKMLIKQCQATGGSSNALGNTTFSNSGVTSQKKQGCFETGISRPTPFQGNRGELFRLNDGSIWEVSNGANYLYKYYPQVLICPGRSQLIVDKKVIDIRRIN